jgi:DNA-nicking Smr family endonuclease
MSSRRKRGLSEEERDLWQKVIDSVAPLEKPRRAKKKLAEPEELPAETSPETMADLIAAPLPPKRAKAAKSTQPEPPKPPAKPALTPLSPIEPRVRRRIARGTVPIEDRIDLHGLTQHAAHGALRGFIVGARARGLKLVLVITGKGRRPGDDHHDHGIFHVSERGVLRRLVPQWLGLPDMRDHVVGFEEAHLAHGGAGAIYVRLRSLRKKIPGELP